MRQRFRIHTNELPREVEDGSTQGLAEKLNEIIAFLQRERDSEPPVQVNGDEIAELRRTIDTLRGEVYALRGQLQGVPEPSDVGRENMQQEPAIRWAKVVTCYVGSSTWTEPTAGAEFAEYCKANPCSRDGTYVDTGTDIYIAFPLYVVAGQYQPIGNGVESGTGVTYCPVGTIIPYHDGHGLPDINGHAITGMEAGWIRRLPYVLKTPTGESEGSFPSGWGISPFPVITLVAAEGGESQNLSITGKTMKFDPCGRFVWASGGLTTVGYTITAYVTIEGTNYPVTFAVT